MPYRRNTPPNLKIRQNSPGPSRFEDSSDETDDYDVKMTMAEYEPTKPISVSIPRTSPHQHSNCSSRRPNLTEILANTAQPPWTLSAFMAYLSQNHCLETLEFTMDASRYRKHYSKIAGRNSATPLTTPTEETNYVKMLWQRLLDAYIAPNGPREVNLPSDVRDSLLSLRDAVLPPHPSTLDPAVRKVYELMEESVLVPFLNSLCPVDGHVDHDETMKDADDAAPARRSDERIHHGQATSHARRSPPPASLPPNTSSHSRNPLSFSRNLGPPSNANAHAHNRFASVTTRHATSQTPSCVSNASASEAMTDDSGSVSSPISDPMTPPTTPPMTDYSGGGWAAGLYNNNTNGNTSAASSANNSPRSSRAEHHGGFAGATANQWKRMSSKLGWKKKSAGSMRDDDGLGVMTE